jgi:nitrite reductase/ring-hydroxylating ferredoxin subunit/uncharacterized membrane protein
MATTEQDREGRFTRREWQPGDPGKPRLERLAESVGDIDALDAPAEALATQVRSILKPGALKDALSGTWLGHALHPLLTDVPIGAWTSATVLDLVGGTESRPAARRLVGLGVAAALPTAAAGWADYADTTKVDERVRRIGIVHAAANVAALGLFTASWFARHRGAHGKGVALSLAGAGAMGAGGHLGGHLSYAKGVGVDRTAFEKRPTDWTVALAESELADGEPRAADVAGAQVLLVRRGDRIFALAGRCSHRGGPLHDGELTGDCIQCPWHGTRFRLEDGSVERGPGTFPQPAYEVRVNEGQVEVRSAER